MFRVAGHLASAVSIRASLVNFWQYYWIELFGENNGTFKLSKSELDYMITISDKVVREAKKEIGVVAEDVGVAIAFAVRTRNHFGVRCAGGIGALHSQKINANGDRAILNIGHYGRFESRVPTHLWSLAHISDHPIGFAFRFVNDEQKDRRFPDLFQLNSKGDLFSLHSYYIHPESAEYEKFIQVCVNDDDGAMVARRICQFGKPVTDECSSIVVWVH
jgi:hypothetical protein